jgi:hypothetical protein
VNGRKGKTPTGNDSEGGVSIKMKKRRDKGKYIAT